ncbi:hypothetical protein V2G26_017334 [Clonostachys chloroleuca]
MVRTLGLLHIDVPDPGLGGRSLAQRVPHFVASLGLLCVNHPYCNKLKADASIINQYPLAPYTCLRISVDLQLTTTEANYCKPYCDPSHDKFGLRNMRRVTLEY